MTTTKAKVEAAPPTTDIHQFQHVSGSMAKVKVKEIQCEITDGDVGGYLAQRGYHLLPGSMESVQTYESTEATRFLVLFDLGHYLFLVTVETLNDYRTFMAEHLPQTAILPYLWLPEVVAAPPENYIHSREHFVMPLGIRPW